MIWHLIHVRRAKQEQTHTTLPRRQLCTQANLKLLQTHLHGILLSSLPQLNSEDDSRTAAGRKRKEVSVNRWQWEAWHRHAATIHREGGARTGSGQFTESLPSASTKVPSYQKQKTVNAARASIYTRRWKDTDSPLSSLKHPCAPSTRRTHTPHHYISPALKMTTPMNTTSLEKDKSQIGEAHSPYKSWSGIEWARLSLLFRQGCWCASLYQSAYVRVYVCTVATVTTLNGGLVCQ